MTLFLCILATLVCVTGDYFLKKSANVPHIDWTNAFWGMVFYTLSAIPWYFAMRHAKLVTLGIINVSVVLICMVLLGVFVFHERLTWTESMAAGMVVVALITLRRFM
jgi:drug/metabolite transporter (DMT)-like permease